MTASQRPERVDRDALIEAAARALVDSETNGLCGENWPQPCDGCDCFRPDHPNESAALDRSRAEHVLDAVLPLIADTIEAEADRRRASMAAISWGGLTHDPASAHYLRRAARLVRSLGDEQ